MDVILYNCSTTFTSTYSNLYQGTKGCGCKNYSRKNLEEKEQSILKLCNERDLEFKGFEDKGAGTIRINLYCPKHDRSWQVRYSSIDKGQGCRECGWDRSADGKRATKEELIGKFTTAPRR